LKIRAKSGRFLQCFDALFGIFGGLPGVGLDSGTAINPGAIVDMPSTFDLYDGGALDFAGLAFAQVDRRGNVNVAGVGATPIGPGGFIDISQKARTVVFCGTLRGGGLSVDLGDGELAITQEGRYPKFVDHVDYISFNADRARARGQRVLYITERGVFAMGEDGVELVEIAPGVDLRRDILAQMGFTPIMRTPPQVMQRRLFLPARAGIRPLPAHRNSIRERLQHR